MPLPLEKHHTLADALAWDEQDRIELIYGDPVMMAPPTRVHQKAVSEFNRQLGNYLDGKKCEVYPSPFAVRTLQWCATLPSWMTSAAKAHPIW